MLARGAPLAPSAFPRGRRPPSRLAFPLRRRPVSPWRPGPALRSPRQPLVWRRLQWAPHARPVCLEPLDCCKNIGLTLPLALRSPLSCSSSSLLSQAWDRFASAVRQNVPGRVEPAIACAGWLSSHPWTRSSIPVSTPSLLIRDTSAEAVLSFGAGQCPVEMRVPVLNRESFPIDVCGLIDRMSKWHKRVDAIHLYLATEKL